MQGHFWLEPAGEDAGYIGLLSVRPDRQDQKLGRTLLAAAEDLARSRGVTLMRMRVINVRDTLIAWYERRGYALTGETEPFPYGDDRFGAPLRDDLCFVVLERLEGNLVVAASSTGPRLEAPRRGLQASRYSLSGPGGPPASTSPPRSRWMMAASMERAAAGQRRSSTSR